MEYRREEVMRALLKEQGIESTSSEVLGAYETVEPAWNRLFSELTDSKRFTDALLRNLDRMIIKHLGVEGDLDQLAGYVQENWDRMDRQLPKTLVRKPYQDAAPCANRLLSPTMNDSNVNVWTRFVAASRAGIDSSSTFRAMSSVEYGPPSGRSACCCFITRSRTFRVRAWESRPRSISASRRASIWRRLSTASRRLSTSVSMSGCRTGSLSFSRRIAARDSNPDTSRPARISPTASAFLTPSRIATTDAARMDGSASRFESTEDTSYPRSFHIRICRSISDRSIVCGIFVFLTTFAGRSRIASAYSRTRPSMSTRAWSSKTHDSSYESCHTFLRALRPRSWVPSRWYRLASGFPPRRSTIPSARFPVPLRTVRT